MISWDFDPRAKELKLISDDPSARLIHLQTTLELQGEMIDLLKGKVSSKSVRLAASFLGPAKRLTLGSEVNEVQCDILLDTMEQSPWAAVQARLRNGGRKAVRIGKVNLLQILSSQGGLLDLGRHPSEFRVLVESGASGNYTGVRSIVANNGVHESKHVSVIYSPTNRTAFLIGQGTVEETWVRVITEYGEKDHLGNYTYAHHDRIRRLCIECDFADYLLGPGSEISTDYILLAFHADPFYLLESYADAVCKLNRVRTFTREDIPVGWMTWYNQDSHLRGGGGNARGAVNEKVVLEQARFIRDHLKEYGVNFIEIDEGYERALGDWEANEFVASGMDGIAKKIKKEGLTPGVWISPFMVSERAKLFREHSDWFVQKDGKPFPYWEWSMAPPHDTVYVPDPTRSEVKKWITRVYEKFVRHGYRFFKNDFVDGPGLTAVDFADTKMTRGLKVWRHGFQMIREVVGKECHIQPCSGPTIAGVGIVDSARIEMDIGGGVGEKQWTALKAVARGIACKYYQNRKFFINDPDNLIVSEYEQLKSYGSKGKLAHVVEMMRTEARVRASLAVLSGGIICLGDRLTLLTDEQLDLIRKCLPVFGEAARPIDMFRKEFPEIWSLDVKRPWGSWKVLSLFNWEDLGKVISLESGEIKLDPAKKYFAWDFWEESFLGEFSSHLEIGLRPHENKLLRIIEKPDHPTIVGTDIHLTQGGVEIERVGWTGNSLEGAAVRPKGSAGNIFVHVPTGYRVLKGTVEGKRVSPEKFKSSANTIALPLRFTKSRLGWEISFREAY